MSNPTSRREFIRASALATGAIVAGQSVLAEGAAAMHAALQAPAHQHGAGGSGAAGLVRSAKSGNWSDPATWAGGKVPGATDVPVISAGHGVVHDAAETAVAGVRVAAGATLRFDPAKSCAIQSTGNVIVEGKVEMQPASAEVTQAIRFVGIDETKFVGGGMVPLETDVGLWVVGAGELSLIGTAKRSWTTAGASYSAGEKDIDVRDAAGWRAGDVVVIVPTDTPPADGIDWDDRAGRAKDPYAERFERRTIVAVAGNRISLDAPLKFDHLAVSTDSGKTWTAEVANLTRNVRIEGTEKGRAHVFVCSTMPQIVKWIEGRYLGPRKMRKESRRPMLVEGRYGLHFHHCMEGSRGSAVEGCALYDLGNRAYVPHMSHGISMRDNVSFSTMEAGFWWDFQELTHDTVWERNLVALVLPNGVNTESMGMALGQGDGNVARGNVVVYGHHGDPHGHGGYVWDANNEGVWIFEDNLSHSNRTGLFVWQNTGLNHTIVNHESYNDYLAIFHGAYVNSYTYTGGYVYGGIVRVKATSGNASGVRFERMTIDGAGKTRHCAEIFPSPVPSGLDHNVFRGCTFKNAPVAVLMNNFPIGTEQTRKHVDMILCEFQKIGAPTAFSREATQDALFRIQPAAGPATRIARMGPPSEIAPFAPYRYGTGTGLSGQYFNGPNFDRLAFARVDSMVMYQQWSVDRDASPTGVHHLITGDAFSVRWTGAVEPQYSGPHVFRVQGSAGFRLWIDGRAVIDSWTDRADNADTLDSPPVTLEAGKRYALRLETFNANGGRGCQLYWSCAELGRMIHIPQSQLYPDPAVQAGHGIEK